MNELKLSRLLASEITSTGATLFDLLGKEVDLRVSKKMTKMSCRNNFLNSNQSQTARQRSIGRQFELSDVETGIKKAMEAISAELTETKQLIENVAATEASLDSKIERRKVEIDRYEKRLQTLKKVR